MGCRAKALLAREKERARLRDQIASERRALPWVRIDKRYVFDAPEGRRTLAELFDGRRQLLVQHFMLAPGWEQGCPSCSFMADHTDGMNVHLAHRNVALVAVSRAPLDEIERFATHGLEVQVGVLARQQLQPRLRRQLHAGGGAKGKLRYNYGPWPFACKECPVSACSTGDAGDVFHTYSTYGRGVEVMMGTYNMLDLTPKGRDESELAYTMAWVRHHDRYEPGPVRRQRRQRLARSRRPSRMRAATDACRRRNDMSQAYPGGCVGSAIHSESGPAAGLRAADWLYSRPRRLLPSWRCSRAFSAAATRTSFARLGSVCRR